MASNLPTTPNDNLGSNYGMDGFPGVDYGKGIRDRPGLRPRPPVSGVSHLPGDAAESAEGTAAAALLSATRMSDDADDALPAHLIGNPEANLDIDLSSESTAFEIQASDSGLRDGQGIVHHEWQEAVQDPARLPQINRDSLADLESLWGTTTTGQELRVGALQELLRVAMRRSAQGESLSSIRTKLETLSRDSWPKIAKSFDALAAEHGLHGNVYIRASAFPGLHRGKHANMLRKLASRARYLVGGDKEAAAALGLSRVESVQDIPWDREIQHYTPKLAAQGKTIQRVGSARESLRQVFLNPAEVRTLAASFPQGKARPTQEAPLPVSAPARIPLDVQKQWALVGAFADRLVKANILSPARRAELQKSTTPQAFRAALTAEAMLPRKAQAFQGPVLTAAPITPVAPSKPIIPLDQLMEVRAKQRAQLRVEALAGKLVRQGAASPTEAKTLSKMGSTTEVRVAAQKLDRVPRGAYSGGYQNQDALKRQAVFDQQKQQEEIARVAAEEQARQKARLKAKVARLQKGATHGEDLDLLIPRLFTAQEQGWAKRAIELIKARAAAPVAQMGPGEYEGKVYTAHQSSAQASYEDHTLASAQRWLKQELHKGDSTFVAQELGRRFASVAKDPSLVQIRSKYEGQAGRVFIDAAAFASPTGIAGCEQAASQLRTASAKYVLAMSRCNGCACRNPHGDCRKYRRPLVASVMEIPK